MTTRHVLHLREHESARIGTAWDVDRKVIPLPVADVLELRQAGRRRGPLMITSRNVTARQFVGVIGVGDRAVEILPKTDIADDATRRQLLDMLMISGLVPVLDAGLAGLNIGASSLLDAVMQAYIRELTPQWRRGRVAGYVRTDRNRSCLKGKLLFGPQTRVNLFHPERFVTRADEFVTDVPIAQLLKAGLAVCHRHGIADETRRSAMALLAEFDEVSTREFTGPQLDAIEIDRRIARFGPLVTLAKLLLRGRTPDRPGGPATYSMLFDMNAVFERYVAALIGRACPEPYRVERQGRGRSLVWRNGRRRFALKPDIVVRGGRDGLVIIDTKWKRLDPSQPHDGVKQADMYQAYAYAREYEAKRVILLYPRTTGLRECVTTYRLGWDEPSSPRIEVRTVNVEQSPRNVTRELETILTNAFAHV